MSKSKKGGGSRSYDTGKVRFFEIDSKRGRTTEIQKEPTSMEGGDLELEIPEFELQSKSPKPEELSRLKNKVRGLSLGKRQKNLSENEVETLKKYIEMRESEVRDLKDQRRQYEAYVRKLARSMGEATKRKKKLLEEVEGSHRKEELLKESLVDLQKKYDRDVTRLRNELEERDGASDNLKARVQDLNIDKEKWREKVSEDLKKIRLKEKELENKYELLKRDTQALLDSKDKHVLELKKKADMLELEIESLEEKLREQERVLNSVEAKKHRLIDTFKLATNLLEEIDATEAQDEPEPKKKTG